MFSDRYFLAYLLWFPYTKNQTAASIYTLLSKVGETKIMFERKKYFIG